jgi:Ca2+-binding EF-hand superfamily protein
MDRTVKPTRLAPVIMVIFCLATGALRAEPGEATVTTRVMQAADKDKDRKLSLAEFLPLDVQARHHGEENFKAGDADKDGFLDPAELAATLRKQTWFVILCEGAEACFSRLDTDQDGKLDVGEYREISRMPKHAAQHFKSADSDQDGYLSKAEFTMHAGHRLQALEGPEQKRKAPKKRAVEGWCCIGGETMSSKQAGGAVLSV